MAKQQVSTVQIKNPHKASVGRAAAWNPTANVWNQIPFDTVEYDTGSNWNTGTNRFTAPVTGLYHVDATVSNNTSNAVFFMGVFKNGSEWRRGGRTGNGINAYIGISLDVQLTAGDYLDLRYYASAGGMEPGVGQNWCQFKLVST